MTESVLDLMRRMRELLRQQPELTQESVASLIGVSRGRVSNLQRLLKAPEPLAGWLWSGTLSPKHIEALLSAPTESQVSAGREAIARRASVAELRQILGDRAPSLASDDITHLERRLSEILCTRVQLDHGANGGGQLRLTYTNLDTLQGLLDRLGYVE
ncbi:ParB/RepB/Spo0J family partition protein [Xanthomonas campestris]|uniref:ParB/RepB/Spo0J family partition protein n=1 Tax=Xanthomonas campestris TaxID=339 RepID=UPI002B22ACD3|nr:hypothetical protein [Xanthomonas campestris]MEA9776913.1 hypothetical protein [Xanthomonas campestris pv. raphani]